MPSSRKSRVGWFVLLYTAGVLAVLAVAAMMRVLMSAIPI